MSEFHDELKSLINKYSIEDGSDTPDFILADYVCECLSIFHSSINGREKWYSRKTSDTKEDSQNTADATTNKSMPKLPEFSMELWNEFVYSLNQAPVGPFRVIVEKYHEFIAGKIGH